ncbi:MAG: hypothetical protein U1F35_09625 [Steroidobacteraceae bacterium]
MIDDLVATGGTAEAAVKLLRSIVEVLAACRITDLAGPRRAAPATWACRYAR